MTNFERAISSSRIFLSLTFHCMNLILSDQIANALLYMAICGDISFTQILPSSILIKGETWEEETYTEDHG